MSTTAVFRDPRVGTLDELSLKDAQLVVSQEALRRGALTSSELGSSAGPVDAVRVSLRSPLWATTVATIYFPDQQEATEWAHDLLVRLPRVDRPKSGARAPVWRIQISCARILGSHVVGGAVLGVLEPQRDLEHSVAMGNGAPSAARSRSGLRVQGTLAHSTLTQLAATITKALKIVEATSIEATVTRVARGRGGNIFLALEAGETAFDAVIFTAAARLVRQVPAEGESICAHVARVSLYQPRGQLTLVLDGLDCGGDRGS